MSTVGYSWLAAFYASLLLLAIVNPGRIVRSVLGAAPLVWLGAYAYCVYLIHGGVNGFLHYAIRAEPRQVHDVVSLGITCLSLVTVLILAAISWRWLERPLIQVSHAKYKYESGGRRPLRTD
jgi:peptidoglycan/LPS O-acetylase OafA/YrhL